MIDKKPSPHDWTDGVMEPYRGGGVITPMLHESIPSRASQVLGPDGEPVRVAVPRRKIGFDLNTR